MWIYLSPMWGKPWTILSNWECVTFITMMILQYWNFGVEPIWYWKLLRMAYGFPLGKRHLLI